MQIPKSFHALTVWRVRDGYQANLMMRNDNSAHVVHGATPEEALRELFRAAEPRLPAPDSPPPPPY